MSIKWWHLSDTANLPADKPDFIAKGRKQPKRRQHSAISEAESCALKKHRLVRVDALGKPLTHSKQLVHTLITLMSI